MQLNQSLSREFKTPPHSENSQSIYMARQPIFDRQEKVFGYELLYRSSNANRSKFTDGNLATSELIINSFIEFGIENITFGKFAFINLTRDYVIGEIPLPMSPENVVVEILEDIEAHPECIDGIKEMAEKGFIIALDDFIVTDANKDLLPYAKIIKVDLMSLTREELDTQLTILRKFPAKLLAEKVETREEYEHCLELGFDYFQGYFFSKPTIIEGKQLQPNQLSVLEIISKLQSPDCELKELEVIIRNDIGVSFKIFKLVNSSFYSLSKKIDSIQHAVNIIGIDALKKWVTLICFSQVENKSPEVIALSLIRAKMCENLATAFSCKKDSAFTVGLFSMLDVLLDQSLLDIINSLNLAEEIQLALLDHEGSLGEILSIVKTYEKGEWEKLESSVLDQGDLNDIYLETLSWSKDVLSGIM